MCSTRVYTDIKTQAELLNASSDNITLRKIERTIIFLMVRIALRQISSEEIASLIPKKRRNKFLRSVAPHLELPNGTYRKRSLLITFHLIGIHPETISEFLIYNSRTVRRYIKRFDIIDDPYLLKRRDKEKKEDNTELKQKLFEILHSPPSNFDINRTTWTIDLLTEVLKDRNTGIGKNTISKMLRNEGYVFRKTREVLTSNDPDYRKKLLKITRILKRLGPMDRFFSIDEFGPVSIRQRGGRLRVKRNQKPTVPQYQDSKGYLIVTAALELCRNKMKHFYSTKKDTEEMVKLLYVLLEQYWDCRRLYFSWDSASWHSSKAFLAEVKKVNLREFRITNQSPSVILAPLPARAQFLNVIESVFSGMAQSVIHNSNYKSVDAAKIAIDRYFAERNDYFRRYPRKAGNKIWGREQVPSHFSVSHNCKHPHYSRLNSIR